VIAMKLLRPCEEGVVMEPSLGHARPGFHDPADCGVIQPLNFENLPFAKLSEFTPTPPTNDPNFGCVNVSGDEPQQRVAAGLSTHVFLFSLLQRLSRLNVRSPFSPLLSSSSMFLAALTSRFQKFALHRLLVQRKTFRVHLSAIFMLASSAGAPDEGQFDTALSQSAWIRAPLGQARLVLVLASPGADARRVRPVC
jgi:hypothetical protein